MGMENRRKPLDKASDWVDHTYGKRVIQSLTQLLLFNFISEEEWNDIRSRMDKWFKESE